MSTYNMDVKEIVGPPEKVFDEDVIRQMAFVAGPGKPNPYPDDDYRHDVYEQELVFKFAGQNGGNIVANNAA